MKWFQVDSDTPDDLRIRDVIAHFGNAGLGALLRLWCFVAKHGTYRPGWSLDSNGKPIAKSLLVAASGMAEQNFDELMSKLSANGHVLAKHWNRTAGVVVFPAMVKRADTYTRRRVRTVFEQSSKFVPLQNKTKQDKTSNKNPPTPLQGGSRSGVIRADRTRAAAYLKNNFGRCPHDPRCGSSVACRARLAVDFARERVDAEHAASKAGRA